MVLEETLKHHFQTLGVSVDDKEFLAKCLDLCDLYNVSEEILVEMWVAFMVEKDSGLEPTLHTLGQMERSVLKTDKSILDARSKSNNSVPIVQSPRASLRYTDNEDILGMYGYKGQAPPEAALRAAPQVAPQVKRLRSPDGPDVSFTRESKIRALDNDFSAAGSSQKSATPRRTLSGESGRNVVYKSGGDVLDWKTTNKMEVRIAKTADPHVHSQPTYMFELLSKKVSNLNTVCREFGARLCSVWSRIAGEDVPATTSNVRQQSQTSFRTWGRILSGTVNHLTANTVMLEGCKMSPQSGDSATVELDLSNVHSYSIFPGQLVAVEGTNPTGNSLVARKLFTSRHLPPCSKPKLEENLHVVVAAGPFTDRENLDYQPLFQLMDSVAEAEPHVLVLIGPFVSVQHPAIRDATILETFQELFEQIIEKVMKYTKGKCTQVVLVPSSNDAHHDPVYPTPEFFLPKSMHSPNLHLVTDPCMLDIEGLTIGTTSADIIRHLSKEEMSRNMVRLDRLPRMIDHVLSQACFYPLYPPSTEINVDTALWEKYAMMYQRPNILVIPSDMQHLVRWLDDCLVINPERLAKRTYVRMIVRPSFGGAWSQDLVDCEVLKI